MSLWSRGAVSPEFIIITAISLRDNLAGGGGGVLLSRQSGVTSRGGGGGLFDLTSQLVAAAARSPGVWAALDRLAPRHMSRVT